MKKTALLLFAFLSALLAIGQPLPSDKRQGIYLTKADFENDFLTLETVGIKELHGGDILAQDGSTEHRWRFGEFYGYRLAGYKYHHFGTKGIFKFFGYYKVLDRSGLHIYIERIPHVKYKYVETAQFSLNADSEKLPLNIRNLKKAGCLPDSMVQLVRRYDKNSFSLATVVNGRSMINQLLFPQKPDSIRTKHSEADKYYHRSEAMAQSLRLYPPIMITARVTPLIMSIYR